MVTANAADPSGRALYRVGGIASLLLGVGILAIFPLIAQVGAPPSGDGEVWLNISRARSRSGGPSWPLVLTDLLFVPVAFALYFALKGLERNTMLIATAFMLLFVVLDLAVTWSHYAALLTLSARHEAATTDVQRAAYVAAADYASAVLASPLLIVYAIVVLSTAILMIGFVMLKGVFSRTASVPGRHDGHPGDRVHGGLGRHHHPERSVRHGLAAARGLSAASAGAVVVRSGPSGTRDPSGDTTCRIAARSWSNASRAQPVWPCQG